MRERFALIVVLLVSSCSNPRSSAIGIVADRLSDAAVSATTVAPPFALRAPVRSPRKRPSPNPTLEPLLADLRDADRVGGRAVGYAGSPSRFYRVGRELLPKADRALLEWLAADDAPVLRSLGFAGLAARGEKSTLLGHVCDREWIEVCPGGCVCHGATTGAIAQNFLWSPAWLGVADDVADAGWSPLLSPAEKTSLAFRLAAVDACSPGDGAREEVRRVAASAATWKALRAATPGIPPSLVVRAVARWESIGSVLIEVLDDPTAPPRARLAAASGLTLSTTADGDAALARQSAFLEAQRPGLARELRDTIDLRRKADALLAKIETVHTWMGTEKLASDAIAAYALRHPLILRRVGSRSYGARDPDVDLARGDAFLWVSEHLGDYAECWNAYRSVAYGLEAQLDDERSRESLAKALPGTELARFEANVRAAIARLDGDASCME